MKVRGLALLLGVLAPLAGAAEPASIPVFTKIQSDYLLACGGCHGENGVSNSRRVPDLAGQVGYFLNTAEGRAYLVRLPNVAAAALDDRALADVMNFMVWDIGSGSAASTAARFTAAEVGMLRKQPLNDVNLRGLRQRLVETLIADHGAPASLRDYTAPP